MEARNKEMDTDVITQQDHDSIYVGLTNCAITSTTNLTTFVSTTCITSSYFFML
jgi:hypothetical protein